MISISRMSTERVAAYSVSKMCIRDSSIDICRAADLLDRTVVHDYYRIRHGKCLLLVMGNIDKGDPYLSLDLFQLDLHLLTDLGIQCAEWLIQQKNLRLIDKRCV